MKQRHLLILIFGLVPLSFLASRNALAQAPAVDETTIERPKIFLDKSPRIVEYQLSRLDNEQLLLVERSPDDPKFIPVYTAILTRAGMSPQYQEEAVEALIQLQDSSVGKVLLDALRKLDPDDRQKQRTARQLTDVLLRQSAEELRPLADELTAATESENELIRAIGYAGLISAGMTDTARELARATPQATQDWLAAIALVPDKQQRSLQRDQVIELIEQSGSDELRRAAIETLAEIPSEQAETFRLVAEYISDPELRAAAVRTALAVPADDRDPKISQRLVDVLVDYAESTPPEDRTTDAFIDAMQLADQLMVNLPVEAAKAARSRLREVTVRVVRIRTVEEEMRYDLPFFAVEAGRPVQIVLENDDLMAHNLVITTPGDLKEVADLGLAVGPNNGWQGKAYVPESEMVLHATDAVQPHQQYRLTFDAPAEPGEYPYVCTFPQHWMRMYGVMVVVEDLDAFLQNPIPPADPIGSNRSFVQAWTIDDFKGELEEGLRGRSSEIGQRIFTEASCAACHKMNGEGGVIGPELTDVFERWKGDREAVLREILDPSHRIDDKYAMHLVLTVDGRTVSGIVVDENKESISLMANPEDDEPTVIPQDDIEEVVKTSTSMMPKALLDQYTMDEIFEMLYFMENAKAAKK